MIDLRKCDKCGEVYDVVLELHVCKPKPNMNFEDEVNKPSHYHKGGIDVIGFSELHYSEEELKGFYRINILKYVDRYDKKGGIKDLKKSEFYLHKLIELEEKHG